VRFSGDLDGDMSFLPWHPSQADRSHDERSFEALLDGTPLPPDAPTTDLFLADVMEALTAPAAADELAGLHRAQAAYTTLLAVQRRRGGTYRRRSKMRSPLSHPKIATALAAGVLGLGGFSAAAYAGALPDTAQQVAHHVIGAPDSRPDHPGHPAKGADHAPEQTGAPTATPVGPDATGAAAFGLCNAWSHANEMSSQGSVAFANLAAAAGGADQVEAYCAAVSHPGSATASHPTGKPTALPTHPVGPTDHPTGKPTALPTHPVGPPSGVPGSPTDHPTGKPSTVPPHATGRPSIVPPAPSGHPAGH